MIRTRFAPSPTGYVHIGNLRTTLFEYLFARKNNGVFIVRVEDTDQERSVTGALESMLKTLAWAGIVPDEGVMLEPGDLGEGDRVVQKGNFGPYIQSERLNAYKKYAQVLLDTGFAYYAFDTAEELNAMRENQQARKVATKYDRTRMRNQLTLTPEEVTILLASDAERVVRLKVPDSGEVSFDDIVHGKTVFDVKEIDDQVLIKSDGFPTYHMAVVVDDHLMEITHVIRGDDWISSTPKHLLLYQAFGWTPPIYAHVPLILNADKSKLSKRQGDVAVEDYQKKGYLAEALVNFIVFCGWNPGTAKELYTKDELIKDFSLEKVSKAGAVFNIDKLNWYNKEYLKSLPLDELVSRALPFFMNVPFYEKFEPQIANEGAWFGSVLSLERERVTTLAELPEAVKFVFELPEYQKELLAWRKGTVEEARKILPELKSFLEGFSDDDWNKAALEHKVGEWIAAKGYTTGSALWPLRVALSGQQNSPGPYEIAEVLGMEESLKRIEAGVMSLGA